MKKFILTVLMCMVMALPQPAGLVGVVYAMDKAPQGHTKKQEHKIFEQLNLSDEQKDQLKANKEKKKEQMKLFREQMKAQKSALHEELMKPELDMDKVTAIHGQIKTMKANMADDRLNCILEVRRILTPEQFTKFIGMMKERRHNWKDKGLKDPQDSMNDAKVK